MSRLAPLDPSQASSRAGELLGAVQKKLGLVPNMMRTMAQAPPVLEAYLGISGALAKGRLDARLRERLALVVAETNRCGYCVAAHTALGGMAGLKPQETVDARRGKAGDKRDTAALTFARRLLQAGGDVTDADVQALRTAGFDDGEIAEVVAHVGYNVFTNLFNQTAGTEIDFPPAPALS